MNKNSPNDSEKNSISRELAEKVIKPTNKQIAAYSIYRAIRDEQCYFDQPEDMADKKCYEISDHIEKILRPMKGRLEKLIKGKESVLEDLFERVFEGIEE